MDFAKAFDKFPKKRLLAKLSAHAVRGNVLRWIQNWLTGRKQRVVFNGKSSGWLDVLSGVPQGFVLGPVLFLIFINNLDVQAELVTVLKKLADDTKLGHVVKCENDRRVLQETLDKMTE